MTQIETNNMQPVSPAVTATPASKGDSRSADDEGNAVLMALISFSKYFKNNDKYSGLYTDLAQQEAIQQAISQGMSKMTDLYQMQKFLKAMKASFGSLGLNGWLDKKLNTVDTQISKYEVEKKAYEKAKKKWAKAEKSRKWWENIFPKSKGWKNFVDFFTPKEAARNTKKFFGKADAAGKEAVSGATGYGPTGGVDIGKSFEATGYNIRGWVSSWGNASILGDYNRTKAGAELAMSGGVVNSISAVRSNLSTQGMSLDRQQFSRVSNDNNTINSLNQVLIGIYNFSA